MPNWDVFHSGRMEVERNLSEAAIREGLARGEVVAEDLARPAGSGEPWVKLSVHPRLAPLLSGGALGPASPESRPKPSKAADPSSLRSLIDEDDDGALDDFDEVATPNPRTPTRPAPEKFPSTPPLPSGVRKATTEDLDPVGFPDSYDRDLDLSLRDPRDEVPLGRNQGDDLDDYDPEAEDEEAAEFTFTRGGAETVEELDLAAMVDVAFQLVLFFLVTASTIVFKALEVPKPKAEEGSSKSSQNPGVTLEQAAKDNILVEIDASGAVKIDHENGPNDFNGLVAKFRETREKSGRLSILLKAESLTKHRSAVNVYDAANEASLGIAIANIKPAGDKPPVPPPAPKTP